MLVIAGGVAGVLLTRSSDVVGQLEAQSVGTVTEQNCDTIQVADTFGTLAPSGAPTHCTWVTNNATAVQCRTVGGKLYKTTAFDTHVNDGLHLGCAAPIA